MNRIHLIGLICLLGCNNHTTENKLLYTNDVDNMAGWSENPTIIRANAHSGNYVCKTDSVNNYGIAFRKTMRDISDKAIYKVDVSAWVKVNDLGAKGAFVCSLDSMVGKGYVYLSERFDDKIEKTKRWTKVRSEFFFPNTYNSDFIFSVYIWNTGKEDIFADDIEIKITEY